MLREKLYLKQNLTEKLIVCTQERMKVREVIPHIGPIPIVIPLKLFLEGIDFLADNVTSRVTWKLRGGLKVQKHVKRSW